MEPITAGAAAFIALCNAVIKLLERADKSKDKASSKEAREKLEDQINDAARSILGLNGQVLADLRLTMKWSNEALEHLESMKAENFPELLVKVSEVHVLTKEIHAKVSAPPALPPLGRVSLDRIGSVSAPTGASLRLQVNAHGADLHGIRIQPLLEGGVTATLATSVGAISKGSRREVEVKTVHPPDRATYRVFFSDEHERPASMDFKLSEKGFDDGSPPVQGA